MAKRTRSAARIKADMEKLQAELKQATDREAERLGSLAIKAGLHEIDAPDTELIAGLKDLAARFRTSSAKPA